MRTMEVRCCCHPKKLLGWLPVPDKTGSRVSFPLRPESWGTDARVEAVELSVERINIHDPFIDGMRTYYALKSEDTPIEVLRRIPGFEEAA